MEIKRTEATRNRPDGDRVIDAPYVFINTEEYVKLVKDEDSYRKNDRNGITIFKTDRLTSVLTCLKKDAAIKDNSVDAVLQMQVLDGEVRISTMDGDAELRKNEMIILHPNVVHGFVALKDSTILIQTIS